MRLKRHHHSVRKHGQEEMKFEDKVARVFKVAAHSSGEHDDLHAL